VSNFLRRLSLPRLVLLCLALPAAAGLAAAAASAVDTGPVPEPKTLPVALHDALASAPVQGLSARIQYTNHLLEGANLAGGGGASLASNPLLSGATGRLWIASDGRTRLELQSDQGGAEVLYDGHTLTVYDGASNMLYRFARPRGSGGGESAGGAGGAQGGAGGAQGAPSVTKVEEALGHLRKHANVSGAAPTNVAGQPAYAVTVSPKERGSLIGSVALAWDAAHGLPLRAAIYSTGRSAPVIELAATEISYGPVESSIFAFTAPEAAKVLEPLREHHGGAHAGSGGAAGMNGSSGGEAGGEPPHVSKVGHGISSVLVVRAPASEGGAKQGSSSVPGTRTVQIGGAQAQELQTALGTILTFERSGARYLLAGFVPASTVEAAARGL
jgi:outer membrane lipoprotein-sorting protein